MVGGHQVTVPPGTFPQSHPLWVRKLRARLEKYARILAGTFQLKCTINFVPGVTIVSQVLSYFFTTMMVYYSTKWGLEFY